MAQIAAEPEEEYPIGIYSDELIIWPLGGFGEQRAVVHLKRILGFSPEAGGGRFGRVNAPLIEVAEEALRKILASDHGPV